MSERSERQVLTPSQCAVVLGLSKSTVVSWCQRQILRVIRIDSRWWLKRADLIRDRWLANDDAAPRAPDLATPEQRR